MLHLMFLNLSNIPGSYHLKKDLVAQRVRKTTWPILQVAWFSTNRIVEKERFSIPSQQFI